LIAAYLGTRLAEVTDLARSDLRTDAATGLLVLDIMPDAATGRTVKNAESVRTLPVPTTIQPALLAYTDRLANDVTRLFPTFGNRPGTLTRKFQVECAKLGFVDAKFHDLRHSAEDHMRETIPDAFRYRIQGRADPHGSARGYGRGVGLKALAEQVEKLRPFG
jgi:integrase